ncbi:hypothetical protein SAMN05216219_2244 [Mycetocola miduiensis]|uniref:Uncharacterized protein n=1 Tax=Mycetocola miduiensis TaxID=995034 RepID=A0A1I5C6E0_9MICO|nr:hypothetical protein SAMN05216219_2244 [Mycetocola miduiensis]
MPSTGNDAFAGQTESAPAINATEAAMLAAVMTRGGCRVAGRVISATSPAITMRRRLVWRERWVAPSPLA